MAPLIRTSPSSLISSPSIACSSEVLPVPTLPTIMQRDPRLISRSILDSTCTRSSFTAPLAMRLSAFFFGGPFLQHILKQALKPSKTPACLP